MKILAIETSCDETAAAVVDNRRVLSNVIFSQINIHQKYGGVYPLLAKRAHEDKIDLVIEKALKIGQIRIREIDAVAVTFGPGLVIALEVGLNKACELASKYHKILIPVDHLEGHIYSCFAQNREGRPLRDFSFPFLALIVSGGHTSLIRVTNHAEYEIIGRTLDDAAGEALDKAAKILGMSYPGGPIIEELAKEGNPGFLDLPIPMQKHPGLDFSYSGLKTAFKNKLKKLSQRQIVSNLPDLAASFQEAVFISIINRLKKAIIQTKLDLLVVGGGVLANKKLRKMIKRVAKENKIVAYFPTNERFIGDNAAMIGVAAFFKYQRGIYLKDNFNRLDRVARTDLKLWVKN
ncbi:MAG TPA: tRNA (adenosine(37)-N6)-threonylcarbamoyltransferase complex transferase subunit TsaD [Candidatus Bathyarchaeia archaeon]|nr:tRNA (adenosine(37)-N6)-threonylcarbamoyltransferase complex transferase subunit TsaD [Candidatus Bathyarchaeia archaeon]